MLGAAAGVLLSLAAGASPARADVRPSDVRPAADAPAPGPWPRLVPAPFRVEAGSGPGWAPRPGTRIVVDRAAAADLRAEAELLAADLASTGLAAQRPPVVPGSARTTRAGDVLLALGEVPGLSSDERYALTVTDRAVLTAPAPAGVFHAGRTLLQALVLAGKGGRVPAARVRDRPVHGTRAIMLDCGRKYFTPGFVEDLIKAMGWFKANTLELHFSENEGFRIASDTHPEVVSADGALSKAEVRRLIAVGRRYHVDVVPSLDSPGHLQQVLNAHPELRMVLADGTVAPTDLDYSKPAARALVEELLGEYAELFESSRFHIGGDEFGSAKDPAKVPQLVDYARAAGGPDATLEDGYNHFQNGLVGFLAARGKNAIVYNNTWDNAKSVIPLDTRATVDLWARYTDAQPRAADWLAAGYRVRNMDENLLYYVMKPEFQAQQTGRTRTPGWLFERWRPDRYIRISFSQAFRYEEVAPEIPGQLGSVLALWCDQPSYQDESTVRTRFAPWLGGYAVRAWGTPAVTDDYPAFLDVLAPLLAARPT